VTEDSNSRTTQSRQYACVSESCLPLQPSWRRPRFGYMSMHDEQSPLAKFSSLSTEPLPVGPVGAAVFAVTLSSQAIWGGSLC
jgi:hypothetical protein